MRSITPFNASPPEEKSNVFPLSMIEICYLEYLTDD